MTDYIKAYGNPEHPLHGSAKLVEEMFVDGSYIDSAGALRWQSNGRVPPEEACRLYAHLYPNDPRFDIDQCRSVRYLEVTRAIEEYRARNLCEVSEEEILEARAAHGPGVEIVNAITGQRFTT